MKFGISLLLLAVSVAAVSARYRSGYDCRRVCGRNYAPVCSTENKNYDNECMLKCDWSFKECDGRCPCYRPPPRPIFHYGPRPIEFFEPRPTYYYESPSPSDCNCAPDKDKVCTADGETYDNECEANCDGKVAVCDGQCPCS